MHTDTDTDTYHMRMHTHTHTHTYVHHMFDILYQGNLFLLTKVMNFSGLQEVADRLTTPSAN